MKIVLLVLAAIVVICIAFSVWSRIAYRRWRRRFDSLPPDGQRKEQERTYKVKAWRS